MLKVYSKKGVGGERDRDPLAPVLGLSSRFELQAPAATGSFLRSGKRWGVRTRGDVN